MLSIEIKVNGTLVAGINAINTNGLPKSNYQFSGFHFPLDSHFEDSPETFHGVIEGYPRDQGILKLVQLMLQEVTVHYE